MPRYDLEGRAALVTGAASGIGLATARALAENGCAVAVNFLPGDPRGPEAAAELRATGARILEAPGAIGDGTEAAMVEAAVAALGRLDLLVNNAGTPGTVRTIPGRELDAITDELWDSVLDTNLKGLFRTTRAAVPALREARGAVVSIASVAGMTGRGSSMAYAASKAGVIALTRHLARGLGPEIRVNAVAPGAVDSTWQIEWTDAQRRQSIENCPLGRRCVPEDIAEVVLFLGCAGAMVNGQTLLVDGGLTL
ncbi:SDR family NAD(P)-dependent oxidoreductase [Pararoseomonas indoligenes]|uniref:SDR family oxidoreductase n=1 Tax=Roseomonas indoligenes TaxID=2820811 RepID=A0A940MVI1_9PROT|nr:SDR family oxidoreductase [Pararoseomonas indoligenes]MBP0491266.1 SDR family oxidoreductase [Pararoseomonas indoligenes]